MTISSTPHSSACAICRALAIYLTPIPKREGLSLAEEEPLDVGRRVIETVATERVVHDRPGFRDRHQTGGSQQREVVLDGRFGQLELLGDLGEVEVATGEKLEDLQTRRIAERPMEPDDGRRRCERVGCLERVVTDRVTEEAPIAGRHQEVVRP